jgi:hypothetical protein
MFDHLSSRQMPFVIGSCRHHARIAVRLIHGGEDIPGPPHAMVRELGEVRLESDFSKQNALMPFKVLTPP